MPKLTDHRGTPVNDSIEIIPVEKEDGSCQAYSITWNDFDGEERGVDFLFHTGDFKKVGIRGITDQALIAIVIDRLRRFQKSPLACGENNAALEHFEHGLRWLHKRTRNRIARGVEGTTTA